MQGVIEVEFTIEDLRRLVAQAINKRFPVNIGPEDVDLVNWIKLREIGPDFKLMTVRKVVNNAI